MLFVRQPLYVFAQGVHIGILKYVDHHQDLVMTYSMVRGVNRDIEWWDSQKV